MSAHAVESAVRRVVARRPDLEAAVNAVAMDLTAGEGVAMIHQAALQEYLWWYLPRDRPEEDWPDLVVAAAALLAELGLAHLAQVASSDTTEKVLAAWARGRSAGAAAFQSAHAKSGVEPPDTSLISWGSVMGMDESTARTAVELALGKAVAAGELVPGTPRWQAKAAAIADAVLSRPLDLPPGQTLAGLVTTERLENWITVAREGVLAKWRAGVANRLLHPIAPPLGAAQAMAPMLWLLELAATPGGAELTQNLYLARASVLEAVERFGWWEWEKPPRSEADVHQLTALRMVAGRLRLVRRRARRLHITQRGSELRAYPARLWELVATETEEGSDFIAMVAEVLGLGLLQGRTEVDQLSAEVGEILRGQGWASSTGRLSAADAALAIWHPLHWWRLFGVLDEKEARWEYGTARRLSPHTIALTPDGEQLVLAYLRARAAGPRHRLGR